MNVNEEKTKLTTKKVETNLTQQAKSNKHFEIVCLTAGYVNENKKRQYTKFLKKTGFVYKTAVMNDKTLTLPPLVHN